MFRFASLPISYPVKMTVCLSLCVRKNEYMRDSRENFISLSHTRGGIYARYSPAFSWLPDFPNVFLVFIYFAPFLWCTIWIHIQHSRFSSKHPTFWKHEYLKQFTSVKLIFAHKYASKRMLTREINSGRIWLKLTYIWVSKPHRLELTKHCLHTEVPLIDD